MINIDSTASPALSGPKNTWFVWSHVEGTYTEHQPGSEDLLHLQPTHPPCNNMHAGQAVTERQCEVRVSLRSAI